jgi:hypothetical protein
VARTRETERDCEIEFRFNSWRDGLDGMSLRGRICSTIRMYVQVLPMYVGCMYVCVRTYTVAGLPSPKVHGPSSCCRWSALGSEGSWFLLCPCLHVCLHRLYIHHAGQAACDHHTPHSNALVCILVLSHTHTQMHTQTQARAQTHTHRCAWCCVGRCIE